MFRSDQLKFWNCIKSIHNYFLSDNQSKVMGIPLDKSGIKIIPLLDPNISKY